MRGGGLVIRTTRPLRRRNRLLTWEGPHCLHHLNLLHCSLDQFVLSVLLKLPLDS